MTTRRMAARAELASASVSTLPRAAPSRPDDGRRASAVRELFTGAEDAPRAGARRPAEAAAGARAVPGSCACPNPRGPATKPARPGARESFVAASTHPRSLGARAWRDGRALDGALTAGQARTGVGGGGGARTVRLALRWIDASALQVVLVLLRGASALGLRIRSAGHRIGTAPSPRHPGSNLVLRPIPPACR